MNANNVVALTPNMCSSIAMNSRVFRGGVDFGCASNSGGKRIDPSANDSKRFPIFSTAQSHHWTVRSPGLYWGVTKRIAIASLLVLLCTLTACKVPKPPPVPGPIQPPAPPGTSSLQFH